MFNLRRIVLILAALSIFALVAVGFSITQKAEAGYVNTGDGNWVWINPLPQGNGLNSVSCTSSTFCKAVGFYGTILTYDSSGGWRGEPKSDTLFGLSAVSCPTAAFCMAVGDYGKILAYDGTNWTTQSSGTSFNLATVNCPTTNFCFAAGKDPNTFGAYITLRYNGSNWTNENSGTIHPSNINCVSTTFCLALTYEGLAGTFNGTTWADTSNVNASDLKAVYCVSLTYCLAVGGFSSTSASKYNGSSWTNVTPGVNGPLNGVSCLSPTLCYVVANNGYIYIYDGASWTFQSQTNSGSLSSISCSSVNNCFAVGGAIINYDGIRWKLQSNLDFSGPSIDNPNFVFINGNCISPTFCMGGGDKARLFDGINLRIIKFGDGSHGAIAVNCTSVTFCIGVGESGRSWRWDGKKWNDLPDANPAKTFTAVNCLSTTFCVASANFPLTFYYFNGTNWTSQNPGLTGYSYSISCLSQTLCFASGYGVFKYNGTNWSAEPNTLVSANLNSISCPTSSYCITVGSANDDTANSILAYNGTSWSPQDSSISPSGLYGVSCPTPTLCYAVGTGPILVSNGTTWVTQRSGAGYPFSTISCPNTSFCLAGSNYYATMAKVKLTVNSTATTNTPGTLVYALAHATEPQIINFDLPGGSVINLAGQVPVIPAGVIVRGSCGIGGPGITLNVTNVTGGIGVSGGNALYGLKITSSNGKLLSLLGTGNKLGCMSLIKT